MSFQDVWKCTAEFGQGRLAREGCANRKQLQEVADRKCCGGERGWGQPKGLRLEPATGQQEAAQEGEAQVDGR